MDITSMLLHSVKVCCNRFIAQGLVHIVSATDNVDTLVVSAVNEIHVLRFGGDSSWTVVHGVASMGEELYVLRSPIYFIDETLVDVYSKTDFVLLRSLSVPGLSQHSIQDMTSCATLDCLLIADGEKHCLHKVTRDCRDSPEIWYLSYKPKGISEGTTCDVCVLVACYGGPLSNTGILLALNAKGDCARKIILSQWIESLSHAVQLSSGEFVIVYRRYWCARGETIAIVDNTGHVKRSYGDWWIPPSENESLKQTSSVAVDSDGFVFVTDIGKSRLVLLNPSLKFVRYIATKIYPERLYLDRNSRRLFVSHHFPISVISVLQL